MRMNAKVAVFAGLLALTACGGRGDDALGDNAADIAEAQADNLEDLAENVSNEALAENLEEQAEAVREAGEDREEAIDESDVNADALTPEQKDAVAKGQ